jgi:asparagine synthase (glutamine-hydrolysing)
MCRTLTHRGPDDHGTWTSEGAAVGIRRLAIIDVEGGKQPYSNEDGSVRCVFNGEIYNYRELASGLRSRGHRLRSGADGEVLVHLWEEEGDALLSRLNGIFGLAIFDQRTGRALLARDRLGVKPLFWSVVGGWLVFGSEVKAVLASGVVPRDLDLPALGEFLAWEYVPAPRTLLARVSKLGPGESLSVGPEDRDPRPRRWWRLPGRDTPAERRSDEEWADLVEDRIRTAVRRQLVSDVPLGAFLSGGVDSSIVVSAMGPSARTFSIGFKQASYNESTWAARVAGHLDVHHTVEIIEPDAAGLFDDLMHYMDDPIADFSIFPTYLVSRVAGAEVTVVLTGDGGDELFGGYETYVAQAVDARWSRVPSPARALVRSVAGGMRPRPDKKGLVNKLKRFTEGSGLAPELEHARWRLFADGALRSRLFAPELRSAVSGAERHVLELFQEAGPRPALDRRLYVDMKSYLAENCLTKVDRMSMACSIEARVPLLDHEVVELAFQLPPHLKLRGMETKPLLKKIAARHVPPECVYRPKEGFSIPLKHWLRSELRPRLEALLDPEALRRDGIFDPAMVTRLGEEHLSARANHSHVLWALMVFQDWKRRWAT